MWKKEVGTMLGRHKGVERTILTLATKTPGVVPPNGALLSPIQKGGVFEEEGLEAFTKKEASRRRLWLHRSTHPDG